MENIQWNVKNADTVAQAVSNMRHGIDCKYTPETAAKPFGRMIPQKRALQAAMDRLHALAKDEYYLAHGHADYDALCNKLFAIAKRRGYVVLTFYHVEMERLIAC